MLYREEATHPNTEVNNCCRIYLGFIYLIKALWRHKASVDIQHYENMPIQIDRKFHLQKLKIFR